MPVRTSRTPTVQNDRPSPSGPAGRASPRSAPGRRTTGSQKKRTRRLLVLVVVAVVLALVPLPAGIAGPSVAVAGVPVGDATGTQLQQLIEEVARQRAGRIVTFVHEGERLDVSAGEVGLEADVAATAEAVTSTRRSRSLLQVVLATLKGANGHVDVPLVVSMPDVAVAVDRIAGMLDEPASAGDVRISPTLEITTVAPRAGHAVDRAAASTLLREAFSAPDQHEVSLPVDVVAPSAGETQLQELADRIRTALQAPLTLTGQGQTVVLQPAELARLIQVGPEGADRSDLQIAIDADTLVDIAGARFADLTRPPTDARIDAPRVPPATLDAKGDVAFAPVPADVTIVPSDLGYAFEPQLVAQQIADMIAQGARQEALALRAAVPSVSTADAEAMGITHLIGTFTSHHPCCQNRVHNIQLLADQLDGIVIRPGEDLSINRVSGERRCEDGYRRDGMIQGGRLVAVCGGGVSQVGTAVMNAAFFAGLSIDEFKPHSWYLSRYPMGREATLNFPSIDVRFTNDTTRPIVLRTSHTGTSITVSLYGTDTGRRVQAVHGTPTGHRPPPTTVVRNPNLAAGTSRTVQQGASGFDVDVTRIIQEPGRDDRRWTYTARYVPQPRIVEVADVTPFGGAVD